VDSGGSHLPRPFACAGDYAECRRLHRQYGTTYYFASQAFRPEVRRRVHAIYGFVRVADEWVDNPTGGGAKSIADLARYRIELLRGLEGVPPETAVLRAFCDVVREVSIPVEEPLRFLDAMEMDITVHRYETYEDLRGYMRGSAASVGLMMCCAMEAWRTPEVFEAAVALGEAMQLTNFLRDVGEDAARGRIYLPLKDLDAFAVSDAEISNGIVSDRFVSLMQFEIARARRLYDLADKGIPLLPAQGRQAVLLARILYARILDCIEDQGYDVFSRRARTTRAEKLRIAARLMLGSRPWVRGGRVGAGIGPASGSH